ncbi:eukaryotic translation initiation factor 3 subunit K [Condylostylus longicornis]|uniref:eukaryotic translation initiation factor 3 subunit K n=1 Tax=Condylostylus longicornis TaxID=2530218 RepID=UPI00244DE631|nr:eukaryotic translation initiation factor 3 subunit K [Condylostylus longicornis]
MEHRVKMEDGNSKTISEMLGSIERYNPDHLKVLEEYVEEQAKLGTYDLEANLAVLKLYQFNPHLMNLDITIIILLKALTNLPHTDFVLAKCSLLPIQAKEETVKEIIYLADILEKCEFTLFWQRVDKNPAILFKINGFFDSIRKFICHVIGGSFQTIKKESLKSLLGDVEEKTLESWMKKYGWKHDGDLVFIAPQDENIKTKNISEKIEFDNLAPLMAQCL